MTISEDKLAIFKSLNYSSRKIFECMFDVVIELSERGEIISELTKGDNEDHSKQVNIIVKALVKDKVGERERERLEKQKLEEVRDIFVNNLIKILCMNRFGMQRGNYDSKIAIQNALAEYPFEELSYAEIADFLSKDDNNKRARDKARTEKEIVEHYTEILKPN